MMATDDLLIASIIRYNCFEMKNVELPNPAFFGISSATGDLVDNHDIIQLIVRPLAGDDEPNDDYDRWEKAERDAKASALAEFDLRPPEALQRDYQRVLRAQAEAIKTLSADVETLKQQLEFQCMRHAFACIRWGPISHTLEFP